MPDAEPIALDIAGLSSSALHQSLIRGRRQGDTALIAQAALILARRLAGEGEIDAALAHLQEASEAAQAAHDLPLIEQARAATTLCQVIVNLDRTSEEIEATHRRLMTVRSSERELAIANLSAVLAGTGGAASRFAMPLSPVTSLAFGAIAIPFALGVVEMRLPPSLRAGRRSLKVSFLGRFEVEVDGRLIESWRSNRGRLVFAYLALNHQETISRHRLMGLFWPEHSEERAENNLSLTVMAARRLLDGTGAERAPASVIRSFAGSYGLDKDAEIWLDFEVFLGAARRAQREEAAGSREAAAASLDEAIAIYAGDFLPADVYEDWTIEPRQRFQDQFVETLLGRARLARLARDLQRSVELNRRLLEVDPCFEEVHRQLMLDYLALGQRSRAVRQLALCREALARHLGVPPEERTLAVLRQPDSRP